MAPTRNQFSNMKQPVCKKQCNIKNAALKHQALWKTKAKPSFSDLLDDDDVIDPSVEAHMSLSQIPDMTPIPLESHDISWECEFDDDELSQLFDLGSSQINEWRNLAVHCTNHFCSLEAPLST